METLYTLFSSRIRNMIKFISTALLILIILITTPHIASSTTPPPPSTSPLQNSIPPKTINVPNDYPTITGAVAHSKDGDTIEVEDGSYFEKNIVVDKKIRLRSKNLYGAIIDGGGYSNGAVIIVRAACEISGFILKNCTNGILQRGSPDVTWKASHLAIFNMGGPGIHINDRWTNIGAAELSNIVVTASGSGLGTNDARGINVKDCFICDCTFCFQLSNHHYFNAENIVLLRCPNIHNNESYDPNAAGNNKINLINFQPLDLIFEKNRDNIPDYIFNIINGGTHDMIESTSPGLYPDNGLTFNLIADIYFKLKDHQNAAKWHQRAMEIGEILGSYETSANASYGLAKIHEEQGDYISALQSYQHCIEIIEHMRADLLYPDDRIGLMEDKIQIYRSLIKLLYRLHTKFPQSSYHLQAFEYAERSKARTFLDSIEKLNMDFEINKNPQIKKLKTDLLNQISQTHLTLQNLYISDAERASALNKLTDLENQYKSLTISINRELQDIISTQSKTVSFDTLKQEFLDEKTSMIEYFIGQKYLYGFLITHKNIYFRRLCESSVIRDYINNYLHFLSFKEIKNFKGIKGSRILYDLFLKPFQPQISPSTKNLIIIPDGDLYHLPFETLIPDESQFMQFRDAHLKVESYLISYLDISYGRSASAVFNVCKNRVMGETDMDLLMVACAQILHKNNGRHNNLIEYPPLKYATKEAKAVLNKFDKGRTKSLLNSDATEENLKKLDFSQFRIIHFVTHGILDKNDWIRSALVLNPSEDSNEDGLFHPFEIQNRKFNADLITLSSCYSGTGKLAEGEGVMGLIRAFQLVGAQSLIASLWEVNDRSTSLFMEYFYQFLAEGASKSSALKQAKLKMIQSKYNHPFYWAPFILFGDYKATIIPN